ncbi:hypothetical protein HDU82_000413 [Entophlyctis luteolus]|nr:hypothetical protein HDU82_000413 [Entophlyctis luteolus]
MDNEDEDDEKIGAPRLPRPLPPASGTGKTDSAAVEQQSRKMPVSTSVRSMPLHPLLSEHKSESPEKAADTNLSAPEADDEDDDDSVDGPMPLDAGSANLPAEKEDDLDDDDESEDDDDDDFDVIPVTRQIKLSDHRRTVSAVSLDPSGARLVTGGRDCTVKLWDFHGMNETFRPFRSIDEPCGGNPIRDLQFSNSGDQFLIASGSNQVKLYDREGSAVCEYTKGDMYLRDMKNTKGHISALTCCKWHPNDRNLFLTASLDSTIRIWNVENKRQNKAVISVKSKEKGGRTAITAATYSPDGKIIAGMGQDGEFRLWATDTTMLRPTHVS